MSKLEKYNDIINNTALTAAGFGIPGDFVPQLDVDAVSTCWIAMTLKIAEQAGYQLDQQSVGKFIVTVVKGATASMIGSNINLNAALNWLYTIRLGKALAKRFDSRNFEIKDPTAMAITFQSMIFVLPTLSELKQAFIAICENS